MNEQDKQAFEAWLENEHFGLTIKAEKVWQAALEYARGKQEPVAYLHTMHMEGDQEHRRLSWYSENPFGKPGRDYSASYPVTSGPLYTTPAVAIQDELELHRADYQACKNAGFESPGELLSAYKTLLAKQAPAVAQQPVHFRAVLCREQQDQAIGVVPKVVGFVDKKAAEQFILEKRDFQGWRYNLEPLFAEAPPAAEVNHSDLIKRIDAAIERVTQGRGLMSIPADPRSDVDLVLSECKALLEGKNPPFWATEFYPAKAAEVNAQLQTPEQFNVQSFGSLWLSYCDKKMEVEDLREVNTQLLEALKLLLITSLKYKLEDSDMCVQDAYVAIAAAEAQMKEQTK